MRIAVLLALALVGCARGFAPQGGFPQYRDQVVVFSGDVPVDAVRSAVDTLRWSRRCTQVVEGFGSGRPRYREIQVRYANETGYSARPLHVAGTARVSRRVDPYGLRWVIAHELIHILSNRGDIDHDREGIFATAVPGTNWSVAGATATDLAAVCGPTNYPTVIQ